MQEKAKSQLKLHLIVFLWGFTAILGVLISIDAIAMVFYRTAIAAVALAILVKFLPNKTLQLEKKGIWKLLGVGCVVSVHWIMFFVSARLGSVSVCLAGMATTTLFTSILEPLLKNTKVKSYEVVLGLIVISGLYLVLHFEFDQVASLLVALGSAFMAALFSIFNSKLSQRYETMQITFYEMVGASICSAVLFPLFHLGFGESLPPIVPKLTDVGYLLILSIVCTVYAFYESVKVLKVLSAFNFNLTINLEPVYGIVLAFLFFGEDEKMTLGFYVGTLVILLAVLSYPIVEKWGSRRAVG